MITVSILIPVYNEQATIIEILESHPGLYSKLIMQPRSGANGVFKKIASR